MRWILLLATATALAAEDAWYRVTVLTPEQSTGIYDYYGRLSEGELARLRRKEMFELRDLRAWNEDHWVPWATYDPTATGRILINGDRVLVAMPITGDPIAVSASAAVQATP